MSTFSNEEMRLTFEAALYLLGRCSGRDADLLKTVTRVNQLKELAQLLDLEHKVLPLIVTISGRVGSETPINCENSRLRGVIVEETAKQHFLKHNDAGSWIQDSALMLSMSKEVPWYLDDGTGRVYVVGARCAAGFALTVGSEVFEESGQSIVRGTLNHLQGLKSRIERVLPTGSSLTVVGEAVKDDIGTIRMQKPHKGPFYVSPKSIDQLISNLGKWARWYKYASFGLTIFGVFLITKHAIHYVLERRRGGNCTEGMLDECLVLAADQGQIMKVIHQLYPTWKAENGAETKRDRIMPDPCLICLEQEYNAVLIKSTSCICLINAYKAIKVWSYVLLYNMLFTLNRPHCRRRIEQVVKVFRH
ncbi:hypothetical protein CRYUN_Cryun20dG0070000 [Craigia yunnanensis]